MTTIANFTVEGPVGAGSQGGNPLLIGVLDASGNTQALPGDATGFAAAHGTVTLLASQMSNVAHANSRFTAVTGLGKYRRIIVVLSVTAAATAAGDTLDVFVDSSPDGAGAIKLNAIHFQQVLGNGGAVAYFAVLDPSGAAGTAAIAATSDCAAGVCRPGLLTDWMQVRETVVSASAPSFTYSVLVFGQA